MFFPNGDKRCGLFENNVFKVNINDIKEYDDWISGLHENDQPSADSVPKEYRDEVLEYIDDLLSFGSPV